MDYRLAVCDNEPDLRKGPCALCWGINFSNASWSALYRQYTRQFLSAFIYYLNGK